MGDSGSNLGGLGIFPHCLLYVSPREDDLSTCIGVSNDKWRPYEKGSSDDIKFGYVEILNFHDAANAKKLCHNNTKKNILMNT